MCFQIQHRVFRFDAFAMDVQSQAAPQPDDGFGRGAARLVVFDWSSGLSYSSQSACFFASRSAFSFVQAATFS